MHQATVGEQVKGYFEQLSANEIICVYVFGSTARGEALPDSDLDVALVYKGDPPRTLAGAGVRLAGELERVTGKPVDIVVLNHAAVDLVHRVLRDGILVYESDRSARIKFEVWSRNVYFDLQPVLQQYRRRPAKTLHG